jgi:hypothetical protein
LVRPGWTKELAKGYGQFNSTLSVQSTNILVQLKTIKIKIVTVRCTELTDKGHSADCIQDSVNKRQQGRIVDFLKKKYKPGSMDFPKPIIDYCSWSSPTDSHPIDELAK